MFAFPSWVQCGACCRRDTLSAKITNGESVQTLCATMLHPNRYGGVHLQHTGTTGASATVVQSVRSEYK